MSRISLQKNSQRNNKKSLKPCQFITKIMEMMKQFPQNVKWSQDGQCIIFINKQTIQNQILPNYFRHRNILSFIRQLNMYYFSKVEHQNQVEQVEQDNNDKQHEQKQIKDGNIIKDSSENNSSVNNNNERNLEVMKFKHTIFRRGNQSNFHMVNRRNKNRDQIISNIQKNYNGTLQFLQKQKISQQAKQLIRMGIQYHSITLKNLKKIRSAIQQIYQHLKTVRSKQIKQTLKQLKQQNVIALNKLIQQQKIIDNFIKQHLCRDQKLLAANSNQTLQPSLQSQAILQDQPRSIKDIQMNRLINFQSDVSMLNFGSMEGLDAGQQHINNIDKDQEISLGHGLQQQDNQIKQQA